MILILWLREKCGIQEILKTFKLVSTFPSISEASLYYFVSNSQHNNLQKRRTSLSPLLFLYPFMLLSIYSSNLLCFYLSLYIFFYPSIILYFFPSYLLSFYPLWLYPTIYASTFDDFICFYSTSIHASFHLFIYSSKLLRLVSTCLSFYMHSELFFYPFMLLSSLYPILIHKNWNFLWHFSDNAEP